MSEETNGVVSEIADEQRQKEEEERRAYQVERFYFNQHGYIPLYIIAPGILLASIACLVMCFLSFGHIGILVLFLIAAIILLIISICMFTKASRIRRRREIALSRMREYEKLHPEVLMPRVIATIEEKPATSSAEELLKWKKLLDEGAITQEEYDAKKKRLLGL